MTARSVKKGGCRDSSSLGEKVGGGGCSRNVRHSKKGVSFETRYYTVNGEKLDVFLRPLRIPLRTLRLKKREFNRKDAEKCKVRKVQFHAVYSRPVP